MKKRRFDRMNLFYIPAILLFLVFVIYPFLDGIRISMTNWNGFSQNYKYVGFANYVKLFKDKNLSGTIINTLIYGVGSTLLQNVIGLAYAIYLNKEFVGRSFLRTVIYAPVMVAPLIMGYMMYFLMQYDGGALNDIMLFLGKAPVDWLAKGNRAVWLMTIINTLQFCGISMVIYLAGLQNIPQMYYEAAAIDGVNAWQSFTRITLPMLIPAITSSVVINLIGGLKLFDIIMALTNGGPGYATHSLSTYVTNQYFRAQNAGYSATVGLFTFLFIAIISYVVTRYLNKKEVEV